jgi:PAS domain S-box-containing protein
LEPGQGGKENVVNETVYVLGIVLQIVASIIALLLVRQAPRRLPWLLIALASFLIVARRTTTLGQIIMAGGDLRRGEMIAPASSFLFFLGIVLMSRMFSDIAKGRRALDESEEALRAASRYARNLIETSLDPLVTISAEGKITDVNAATEKITGMTRDQLVGSDFADYFTEPEMARAGYQKVFADGTVTDYPLAIRHVSGTTTPVLYNASVYRNDRGDVLGIFAAARDITELKRSEQALMAHSHDLMRYIIEHNRSAVAVHDRDLRYVYVSKRYLDEYKVKESDIIGKHHYEVFPDLPQKWRDVHQRALAGIVSSAENDSYVREDGTVDWTRWECRPWYEADGTIGGIILYTEIITERKRAEDALRESERRYRTLFDQATDGILIMDPEGRIVDVNKSFADMHGYTADEIRKRGVRGLDTPETETLFHERTKRIFGGETLHYEVEHYHKDGHRFPLEVVANRIELDEKQYALCFHRDLSERKEAETNARKLQAQLLQAQKMDSVGRLAGGVAHDFNNMLGVILGHTEMVLEQLEPGQPFYADLKEIRQAAERSADLTRQLLAFARKQTVAPKPLDLNETVGGMLKMLRRLIGEDIDLAWLPADGLWSVKVDPSQIDQILANLCVNARDAIESVGKVTIETENIAIDSEYCNNNAGFVPGEYVTLAVNDNGCGMDKETLTQVFDPFFTTKKTGKGTGLGLATVYGVVKQNNGFINVYSEPGHGTTFRIYLPRYLGKNERTQPEGSPGMVNGGCETVLLVEDESAILKMTQTLLERLGYSVLIASSPGEAIRLAHRHEGEIHLLMTDVVMPDMNGRDLARNLIQFSPRLKCLFMSGYTANVIAHHGVLDEGVHFIQKPFSKASLAAKLREVLESREPPVE